jgi:hypothetical protein
MSEMKTFREAYAVLQKHAQTLRSQQEPDIDNLTTIVSESLAAHKVCKERTKAVRRRTYGLAVRRSVRSPRTLVCVAGAVRDRARTDVGRGAVSRAAARPALRPILAAR